MFFRISGVKLDSCFDTHKVFFVHLYNYNVNALLVAHVIYPSPLILNTLPPPIACWCRRGMRDNPPIFLPPLNFLITSIPYPPH